MHDETHEAMILSNKPDLPLPKVKRIVGKDIEEGVVLRSRQWKFQHLADEIRHHGTAPAKLSLQMSHVGNRHVVGKIIRIVPIEPTIKHSGPEAKRTVLLHVSVDLLGAAKEFFPAVV